MADIGDWCTRMSAGARRVSLFVCLKFRSVANSAPRRLIHEARDHYNIPHGHCSLSFPALGRRCPDSAASQEMLTDAPTRKRAAGRKRRGGDRHSARRRATLLLAPPYNEKSDPLGFGTFRSTRSRVAAGLKYRIRDETGIVKYGIAGLAEQTIRLDPAAVSFSLVVKLSKH
jgi:hypothetical protein